MREIFRPTDMATLWSALGAATVPFGRGSLAVPRGRGLARRAGAWLRQARATFRRWQERARTREQLLRLDDRELRDIGLTRLQAEAEASKPFWRV